MEVTFNGSTDEFDHVYRPATVSSPTLQDVLTGLAEIKEKLGMNAAELDSLNTVTNTIGTTVQAVSTAVAQVAVNVAAQAAASQAKIDDITSQLNAALAADTLDKATVADLTQQLADLKAGVSTDVSALQASADAAAAAAAALAPIGTSPSTPVPVPDPLPVVPDVPPAPSADGSGDAPVV